MNEFKPTADFVSRTMDRVEAYEAARAQRHRIFDTVLGSHSLRYTMSWCGIFFSIILSPAVCL